MLTDRRDFLQGSILGALGGLAGLSCGSVAAETAATAATSDKALKGPYGLTKKQNPNAAKSAYLPGASKDVGALPYVYVYYDFDKKQFLSALDVTPDPDIDATKTYTLSSKLHAFNIRKSDQQNFSKLQNNVQLAFNVTAPNPLGDLTWVFMNAIDIFGGKSHANPDALSTFLKGSSPGAALGSQPKVTITKGALSLQVMAYGQKQKGFWQSFFSYITSIIGNPTTATALTGFGIPGLAVDALQFVDHALTELTKNEGLIPLWQTGSLDFGIAPKTKAIFKMRPGIWLTIDHDYASDSKLLDGHSLDLALGSYRLYDKDKKMADANYLVTDFGFDAAS